MNAYTIGSLIGSLIIVGLLTRLTIWGTNRMGPTPARIVVAHAIAWVISIVLAGFGHADGGPWNPGSSWLWYSAASAVWMILDFAWLNRPGVVRP